MRARSKSSDFSVLIIRSSHLQPASTRARQLSRPKKLSCMSKQPQSLTHPRRSLRFQINLRKWCAWRLLNIARHLNLAMFCGRSGLNCSRQRRLVNGDDGARRLFGDPKPHCEVSNCLFGGLSLMLKVENSLENLHVYFRLYLNLTWFKTNWNADSAENSKMFWRDVPSKIFA